MRFSYHSIGTYTFASRRRNYLRVSILISVAYTPLFGGCLNLCYAEIRSLSLSLGFTRRLVGSHPSGTPDSRLRRVVNSDRGRRQSRLIEIQTGTTALGLIFNKGVRTVLELTSESLSRVDLHSR